MEVSCLSQSWTLDGTGQCSGIQAEGCPVPLATWMSWPRLPKIDANAMSSKQAAGGCGSYSYIICALMVGRRRALRLCLRPVQSITCESDKRWGSVIGRLLSLFGEDIAVLRRVRTEEGDFVEEK